jgi:anti-sigma B factor antagonist
MNHSLTENGKNSVLHVEGALDALSSPELRPTLELLAHNPGRNITIDLSELELIDSSGLGALISLYKHACANGCTVTFVGVADQPLVLFKLLRLDRAFGLN